VPLHSPLQLSQTHVAAYWEKDLKSVLDARMQGSKGSRKQEPRWLSIAAHAVANASVVSRCLALCVVCGHHHRL
jgi:hypothetical protein